MKTPILLMGLILLGLKPTVLQASRESQHQWIRPAEGEHLIWGIKGRVVLALQRAEGHTILAGVSP